MTSILRQRKRHQTNITRFFNFGLLSIKISGYTCVESIKFCNYASVRWIVLSLRVARWKQRLYFEI